MRKSSALAKKSGRVVPEHQQALDLGRGRVLTDVVHSGQVGDLAQHCGMRPRDPCQHDHGGQRDREPDAGQQVQREHGDDGGDAEPELAAAEVPEPPELRDLDDLEGGEDHEAPQRRHREVRQDRPGEQQDEHDGGRGDPAVGRRACPRHLGQRGAAAAARDREPGREARPRRWTSPGRSARRPRRSPHRRRRTPARRGRCRRMRPRRCRRLARGSGEAGTGRWAAESGGSPCGMLPTTLTPCSSSPSAVVSTVAPSTASNGQGSRGANRVPTNRVTMTARLMASVGPLVASRCCTAETICAIGSVPSTCTPRSLPSCPATMITATPAR